MIGREKAAVARATVVFRVFVVLLAVMVCGAPARAQVPVVFRVSEGVRPGGIVSLYGEYLTGPPEVRFLNADGSVAATTAAVQTDPGGHFRRVVFPAIPPGVYGLSARNDHGWSTQRVFVNRAEPRWISEERAYPGLRLRIIGRNLDGAEYNAGRQTLVVLFPRWNGVAVSIKPDSVNPYCVEFTVPDSASIMEYYVEVSTGSAQHGEERVRLDNHSEFPDQVQATLLRVEPAPAEPMARALKVAWANDFAWDRVVNARSEFGAKGDGTADDTIAIQAALDHAASLGGGVVDLPRGTYRVSALVLPEKCILRGESREQAVVLVSKVEGGAIIPRGGNHGIARLTFRYQPAVPPDRRGTVLAGKASQFFLFDTAFDLVRQPDVSSRQSPYYFEGDGPLLVAGCRFLLSTANQWDHAVKNRVTFRDNHTDMHDGLGFCMSSEKLLLLNNEIEFHPAPYAGQMNGFFLNEGWVGWNIYNAYIADNTAHDLNGPGDCQPFAADSAWSCMAGGVTAATRDSVDVRADVSADLKGLDTHEMELIVIQGKGLGQIRRASAKHRVGGNPAVVRFTVCPPWEVPPDGSSVVSAGSWHVNNVFHNNTARGSKSPYNMYYGGCYDCVDSDAVSENTDGWYNWGRIGEYPTSAPWHTPVYFSQLRRSRFTGLATGYATMGITLRVENETKHYRGIADYGTEIRDNTIDRSACPDKPQRLAGNAAIATFNQSWMTVTGETPLLFATLCEGNIIKNSAVGFDLNGSFSFAIRGTVYENCPKAVNDKGHATVLLPGSAGPMIPAVSIRSSSGTAGATAPLK